VSEQLVPIRDGVLIPIAGVFRISDGLQVVAEDILLRAGDTRPAMVINLVG
jgi:Na+-driven multidrug efflux pump